MRFLIPLILGTISVAQAGLNRRAGAELGWPTAALLNNLVLFAISCGIFFMNPPAAPLNLKWSSHCLIYLLPGVLGIFLVMGIPLAISKWGATEIFIGLILSQILSSVLWDAALENRGFTGARLAGVLLSLAGTALLGRSS